MKNILILIVTILLLFSCKKKEIEEIIVFETTAGSNTISTSGNYSFQITLKSKMPSNGIRIEVSAIEEVSGTSISPQMTPLNTSTAVNSVSVQNLPRQKWAEATVRVTSLTSSTNTASTKFRVIYK